MLDVCDRKEKVEVLERIQELVGSPKGIWESRKRMCKIVGEFDRYLPVIPVVSSNGQKYDMNVMKAELLLMFIEEDPASEDESDAITFTIKRNSSMACFESAHLRFVDITNFIAPGSNYAGYLKAFGVVEPNRFFPYQKKGHKCLMEGEKGRKKNAKEKKRIKEKKRRKKKCKVELREKLSMVAFFDNKNIVIYPILESPHS